AKRCALNGLAVAKSILNDLDRIEQILRVDGFVASEAGWGGQPGVINGASEVLFEILGERGRHARAAVGVSALPLNVPVEVAMVIAVSP
ncbi:MAG: RidA family protein, partial [Planctomycetota bacterium]